PALSICKPTGVALGRGRRIIIVTDTGGVGNALVQLLETKSVEVLHINGTADSSELTDCLNRWIAAGPVHGIYWLPALDNEGPITQMDSSTWHENLRVRVKSLFATMRTLYEHIAAPGTFLVSATRLGGQHGYDQTGAVAPLGGAVVGFTKTYKRERAEALVKAVDF